MQGRMLIDNEWVESESGKTIACIDPATEEEIGRVPAATAADAHRAARAARRAFESSWRISGDERAAFLRKIADGMVANREELAQLETLDNGKPLPESYIDVDTAVQIFRMYADFAEELGKEGRAPLALPVDYLETTVSRHPIGVIGAITPWNFPIEQFTWKVAPALAAGCTVVVKPSEFTSLTALELARIAVDAGLPKGVLNVVTGYGAEVGEGLVTSRVDKVSFTGSTRTGSRIMEIAARDLKPVSLELGGKSPVIVFDDADIEAAVEWVLFGAFINQGQVCTSTSRLLVQEGIRDEFLARLQTASEKIVVGPGMQDGVRMGPLVSAAQYEKVLGYIEAGRRSGAMLLTGGSRPDGMERGFFLTPTIFTDVTEEMSIWKEEIFGPVLSVMSFKTEDDAIRLANASAYGLAATVLTSDLDRSDRVAERLDAGIVWQNCNQMVVIQAPWGGVKKSGFGRELGRWGLEANLHTKQTTRMTSGSRLGWYSL